MTTSRAADGAELVRALARDLMILTEPEIQKVWSHPMRKAVTQVAGKDWCELVPPSHNPIYHIAEKVAFANVTGDPEFLYAPTHRDILARRLLEYYLAPESEAKSGFLVLMQRDSFKSTFMHLVMPIFVSLREKRLLNREARILLVHYKEDQASLNLQRLKTVVLTSKHLAWTYPEMIPAEKEGTKTTFDWAGVDRAARAEPSVSAIGINGDITGKHFDHAFFSDLVTEESRTSKVIRTQVAARYESMLYTLSTGRGKRWHDGTPYHIHDLWRKMIDANVEGKPLYVTVQIPAWNETDDSLSLPHRHTKARLEQMRQEEISRTGNDFLFCLQMLLQVKSLRFIAGDRRWYRWCRRDEVPPQAWRAILCDAAWKGTHNAGAGDYASIQVWAFERRGQILFKYLIDGAHSNEYTSFDGEREIMRLMQKWDVMDVAVEEHGGHAFRTSLGDAAAKRGLFINLIDLKMKQTQKQGRMSTFLKDVQAGHVFICDEADEATKDALQEETDIFPQCIDELNDALDAAAYSCDPNIADAYMPAYTRESARRPVTIEPRRTRYCGI